MGQLLQKNTAANLTVWMHCSLLRNVFAPECLICGLICWSQIWSCFGSYSVRSLRFWINKIGSGSFNHKFCVVQMLSFVPCYIPLIAATNCRMLYITNANLAGHSKLRIVQGVFLNWNWRSYLYFIGISIFIFAQIEDHIYILNIGISIFIFPQIEDHIYTTGTEGLTVLCVLGSLVRITSLPLVWYCHQMWSFSDISCLFWKRFIPNIFIQFQTLCQLSTSIGFDVLQACLVLLHCIASSCTVLSGQCIILQACLVLLLVLAMVLHRNCVCEKVRQTILDHKNK